MAFRDMNTNFGPMNFAVTISISWGFVLDVLFFLRYDEC